MKKTLTIEHLAPYLPYGVQMLIPDNYRFDGYRTDAKYLQLTGFKDDYIRLSDISGFYPIADFKPLLIPLSELTSEFMVNGCEDITNYISKNDISKIHSAVLYYMQYGHFMRLVSWHFDVFDLINKGLALNKLDYI